MIKTFTPNDPLFGAQWHLQNTGQTIMGLPQAGGAYRNDIDVVKVWPDYTGRGVVVGVIDDGVQMNHPDLQANLLLGKFFDLDANTAGTPNGEHGTAAIGLILAAQNSQGGVGVAFGSQGIGYKASPGVFNLVAQRMLTDGVAVSSNSWGLVSREDTTPFKYAEDQAQFDAVLADLAKAGRNGLGTATLFAGGNERMEKSNTLFDLTNNSAYVINVAAANADGTVATYSTPGPNVLVAAPGSGNGVDGATQVASMVTTDLLGTAGYNKAADGNYTNLPGTGFNGTSAATPVASGVVALMLEANPNLGYRDVQEILAYSARTPDGVATWSTNGATDWNGGGHRHNADLGFGLIDAHAAVRLAETWNKQSTFANIAGATSSFTGTGSVSLAAGQSRQFTASFAQPLRVQHVAVSVDMSMAGGSSNLSAVTLTLTGPNGTTTTALIDPASYSEDQKTKMASTLTYTFDTVQNWGELSNSGAWTLSVSNASTGSRLDMKASISLIGDLATGAQTFVYTDDYAHLAGSETARAALDATAAPNVLNAAAVTSDTTVNLAERTATIAGVATRLGETARFASLIGGDGNDRLTGNDAADVLVAARGDDVLQGGGGTDTLAGGQGSDTLMGGADADMIYGNQDADLIYGNQGADKIFAGQGDDRAFGGQGDDQLIGNAGADTLLGNAGADLVYGNQGTDVIYGNQGADTLFGGQDADTLMGGQDMDMLFGNLGADVIYGNLGADVLYGGQGADTLYGGQGDDVLVGGLGNDVLVGGLGADRYVFAADPGGRDLIVGFQQASGDRIVLGGQGYTLGTTRNGDALLTLTGGGVIDLAGIRAEQVNASFFATA